MEELNMEKLTNNQIQFLREKLKKEVRQYIELDDKIKALNKAAKDYRKTKSELSESILETMKKFEINDMNIKSGKPFKESDFKKYGRDTIDLSLLGECQYYADFSVNNKSN